LASIGGEGGGALRLRAQGTLIVDGEISANGSDGRVDGSGGGAGGSLWISVDSIAGSGLVAARGGAGEPFLAGGGGGGRIAIYSPTQLFHGVLSASGGPGYRPGETGTVFLSTDRIVPLLVVGQSPSGIVTQAVSSIDVTFSAPLDASSIDATDVSFSGPGGLVTNVALSLPEPARLQISFPAQSTLGTYTLVIGQGIQSVYSESLPQPHTLTVTLLQLGMVVASQRSGNSLLINWVGAVGQTYQPLSSTNLVHWTAWGDPILCTNSTAGLDLQIPLDASPKRFFKLVPLAGGVAGGQ
jgi:hypothetical protein